MTRANNADDFFKKIGPATPSGCRLWRGAKIGPTPANPHALAYGRFKMLGVYRLAHRVAWELLHGPIPKGMDVCHRCDTPLCVNTEHLFLGTHADNMRDASAKRRIAAGERAARARLSEADVRAIRASDLTNIALARQYGIDRGQISRIRAGKAWGNREEA